MSDIAVRAAGIGKQYRIGANIASRQGYKTLQEDLLKFLRNPFKARSAQNTFWALRDISFEVKHGEVLGIIGRNGAGKSTLLKVLSRITKPTTGYADVYGRIGSLLEVGTGFHPELTGRENIFLNGAILGMRRAEIQRRFDEIVDFAEIEQFLETPVKRYSSGMYMRLAFAVAAHLDPEVLVVDEVLAVGDAKFQEKCLGKMQEVAQGGRTVLFVSHNMDAILKLCERAIILDKGNLTFDGDVQQATQHYLQQHKTQNKSQISFDIQRQSPIEVMRIEIVEEENAAKDKLTSLVCLVDYVVHKPIGSVVAIRIRNQLGIGVMTLIDTDTDQQRFYKQPGMYRLRFRLPDLILAAGIYDVTVSLSDMKAERFQFLESIVQFEVLQNQRIENTLTTREGIILLSDEIVLETIE